jgi:signal transduction histidine kinase
VEVVTGSSLSPNLRNLRIKTTLVTLGAVLLMFIFSTIAILQFTKLSFDKPLRVSQFDNRMNEFRQYETYRKELIISELWYGTILTFLILLVIITIMTWIGSYYLIKPISDSIKSKEEFLEHSSHELRSPLAILHSDIELSLQEQTLTGIKEINNEALMEIKRLQNLSNTLLNNISENKTKVDVNLMINGIIQKLNKVNTNRITFNIQGEREDNTYSHKLYNILYNLLDNTIKYSTPNSEVDISIDPKSITIINSFETKTIQNGTGLTIVNKLCAEIGCSTDITIKEGKFIFSLIKTVR